MKLLNNKRIILTSQFINNFGSAFSRIALIILVTTWYRSPIYIGIYSFFLFIPRIIFASPVGYLIDSRNNQKTLLLVSSFFAAVAILIIAIMTFFKFHSFVLLIVLAVIYSVISGIYTPSITKLTVYLFDKSEFNDINASISSAMTAANLFSGIIVSYFVSFLPFTLLFLFDFASYIFVMILLSFLDVPQSIERMESHIANETRSVSMWNSFKVVKDFLRDFHYIIPVYISAILFNILLAPMNVYLTQVSYHIFNNTKFTGLLESFYSFGFLIGSLVYKFLCIKFPMNRLIQASLLLVPITLTLFGSARTLPVALIGLIGLGIVIPFFNISSKTIIQNKVPRFKLGAIFNSYFALMNLSQQVGLLGIPVLITAFGITNVLLVSGVFYLIAAIMLVLLNQISVELNE